MEEVQLSDDRPLSTAKAQRLRVSRILRGTVSFACTAAIVVSCWAFGFLDGARAVHYVIAVVAINAAAVATVFTGLNLRLRDPSLTAPLVVSSLLPSLYVMYHVSEPMIRAAFLLMGTVAVLFGALALDRRRMIGLCGITLTAYVALLALLYRTAPERLDLRVEGVLVLAYFIVLTQVASLGTFINGLRYKLRERNASLVQTMAELEELATRDPLTRLPNRHTAMTQLERELCRVQRRRQDGDGLCVGLLDVDHFKRVNDRFGHQTGDAVLRRIGETLNGAMRQGDFVARFGGEEFLIILPETSLDGGLAAAERMRAAVAAMDTADLPMTEPPTVSIGLAVHDPARRIEETLGLADQALYRAKHLGRNRVEAWQESAAEPGPADTGALRPTA